MYECCCVCVSLFQVRYISFLWLSAYISLNINFIFHNDRVPWHFKGNNFCFLFNFFRCFDFFCKILIIIISSALRRFEILNFWFICLAFFLVVMCKRNIHISGRKKSLHYFVIGACVQHNVFLLKKYKQQNQYFVLVLNAKTYWEISNVYKSNERKRVFKKKRT